MSKATITSEPQPAVEPEPQTDWGPRRYIYCIIDCDQRASFGPMGIGNDSEVFAIPHEGLAVVVSSTPTEKFEISRENTLAHQRVMEAVMERGHTTLPVRFDTIAEDKPDGSAYAESRIVNHVLTKRKDEFADLLGLFSDRVELGVKGLWTDMSAVFAEIVDHNGEIRLLRDKVRAAEPGGAIGKRSGGLSPRARLGEMVKKDLEAKRNSDGTELIKRVAATIVDLRENKVFGDPMFANLALLVEKSRQEELTAALTAFVDERGGRVKLKYVGPVPPSNFLELVITWDD